MAASVREVGGQVPGEGSFKINLREGSALSVEICDILVISETHSVTLLLPFLLLIILTWDIFPIDF